jgi:hemolysin activation/secretion protein
MMTSRKSLLIVGVSMLTAFGAQSAYAQVPSAAQTTASPGRIDQQIQQRDLSSDAAPAVSGQGPIAQNIPAGAQSITFILNNISFDGASTYSADDMASIYANKIGQTISLADVYNIAEALTVKYRNDGFILTQVVVPPQTIDGGNIKLRVVEGFIDRVSVEGASDDKSLILVRQYAEKIQNGGPVNAKALERSLLLINDLPGVSARSVLSPSKTKTGGADLTILVERDPFDAVVSLDNYGSRFLGPWQVSGAGSFNSVLGMNERITVQSAIAPNTRQSIELGYYALGYSQPIGAYGTSLDASFSYTDTDPGFTLDPFEVEGQSSYYRIGLSHPFVRTRNFNLTSLVYFDARNVESKNIIEATREDRIRAIRFGSQVEFLDTLVGVGVNSFDVEFSQGLGLLGASDKNDANLTRALGDPRFSKITFEAQRLQRLVKGVNLLVGAKGQLASSALLSAEEFGVGGMGYGRGFDPSEVVGDDGIAGKLELQWSPYYEPQGFLENYQLFTFVDGGRVWNKDATTSADKVSSAASVGLGARTGLVGDLNVDFTVAVPLNRDVQTEGDDDPRFFIGIQKGF